MKPIISGSGIRGIFGSSLDVRNAAEFAAAFGAMVGAGPVAVGRDTRRSGPAVEAAVSSGLMAVGCDPVLLGVVPTPTVQLEAMGSDMMGGIAITSSHNPGEWNALKLIGPDGVFLRRRQRERLLSLLDEKREWADYRSVGMPQLRQGAVQRHVEAILRQPWVVREGRRLKAVLDFTGGAAAEFGMLLMQKMGIDAVEMNRSILPSGDFPRIAEPTVASLAELSVRVTGEKADVGFAFDPDGDRLALVDQRGRVIGEDYTVALAIEYLLSGRTGDAVVNLSTSRLAEDAAARNGRKVYRSPVGEVNVVEEMERRECTAGGEGNGGVIDAHCHSGRDSGVAMACVVSMLRRDGDMTLGDWADGYPDYVMEKHKIPFTADFTLAEEALVDEFGDPADRRDGLWFSSGGGWMHIRPSGTEPVVRFIAENESGDVIRRDFGKFEEVMGRLCVE